MIPSTGRTREQRAAHVVVRRWLAAIGVSIVLPGAATMLGLIVPRNVEVIVPAAGVVLATVIACRLVMPVVALQDSLEFFGHFCLIIPLVIAESAAGGGVLAARFASFTRYSAGQAAGFSLIVLIPAFLLSFIVTLPFAIVAWARHLKTYDPTRCRKCGYRIDNLPGPRCPECGTDFDSAG